MPIVSTSVIPALMVYPFPTNEAVPMIRQSRGMTAEGRLSLSVPLRDRHKGRYAYNMYDSPASLPSPHCAGRE